MSLVRREQAPAFIQKLKDNYFAGCVAEGKVKDEELDSVVFDSRPSSGGAVLKLHL